MSGGWVLRPPAPRGPHICSASTSVPSSSYSRDVCALISCQISTVNSVNPVFLAQFPFMLTQASSCFPPGPPSHVAQTFTNSHPSLPPPRPVLRQSWQLSQRLRSPSSLKPSPPHQLPCQSRALHLNQPGIRCIPLDSPSLSSLKSIAGSPCLPPRGDCPSPALMSATLNVLVIALPRVGYSPLHLLSTH